MITHHSLDDVPSKLQSMLRLLLAITGGVLFATFAWETPEDEPSMPQPNRSPVADRDRADDRIVDLPDGALQRQHEWGTVQALTKKQDSAELNSSGSDVDAARGGSSVREDQALPGTSIAAGMPHSRSPPEEDAP